MNTIRRVLLFVTVVSIVSLSTPTTQAYSRSHRGSRSYHSSHRGYRGGRSGYSAASRAYADLVRANAMRAAAIRAAQTEVSRAHYALRRTRTKIERDNKLSPEMNAAEAEHAAAERELNAARQAARERLASDARYKAAKAANDTTTIAQMHSAAYQADSDVRAALARVQAAASKLTELKRDFKGSVTRDSQWTAAQRNLENARMKLAQSQAAGNRALTSSSRSRTGRSYPRR